VFNMTANDAGNSSEKKKTRGVTTGQSLTCEELEKLHIEFDDLGQPTGFYKSKFATDMGVLVRNIKITYQSWKKVPWGEKETLWKDAKNTWKLDDDKQKIILKILSGALKEFRSRLTRTYITKTLKPKEGKIIGDSPVGKYKAITNEIWEEFKKQRMDKRFLWVWKEKEQKGEFIPTRFEDALTKALGKPEHNGRTRGVGRHVGLQTYFGRPTSRGSNGKIYTEDDMRLLMEKVKSETKEEVKREAMKEMNAMMEKKWAEFMGKTASVNQNVVASAECSLSHRQEESSSHSTHYTDPFVKLKESVHCRLAVYMNGELIIVAEGMVSPWVKGKTVHNKPLSMENAHVSIDSVIRADAPFPLPWNGFTNVGEAEGSFSQWPKSLILMGNEVKSSNEKKRKDEAKYTREYANKAQKLIKGKDIAQGEEQDIRPLNLIEVDGLDHYCQALEKKLCSFPKDEVIKMVIDESVYNYKEGNTVSYLTIVEIRQMFRSQWLNVVVLQIWGRRNFAKKNNQLQIKVIECPQQPEHYECGYYVMKWMYNITFYYSKGNEEQFEKIIGDSTMSLEDMNEVKEVWATKCLENM
ncbi:hypothetical protein KSS87_021141, partial [Heliosperma pusillum]